MHYCSTSETVPSCIYQVTSSWLGAAVEVQPTGYSVVTDLLDRLSSPAASCLGAGPMNAQHL